MTYYLLPLSSYDPPDEEPDGWDSMSVFIPPGHEEWNVHKDGEQQIIKQLRRHWVNGVPITSSVAYFQIENVYYCDCPDNFSFGDSPTLWVFHGTLCKYNDTIEFYQGFCPRLSMTIYLRPGDEFLMIRVFKNKIRILVNGKIVEVIDGVKSLPQVLERMKKKGKLCKPGNKLT